MINPESPSEQSLIAEYIAANNAYMHYDKSWQNTALLAAGVIIFWGIIAGQDIKPTTLALLSNLMTILMAICLLNSHHNRQIYLCKLTRIYKIELILGLMQHTGWSNQGQQGRIFRTFGPKGHDLEYLTFIILGLGTTLITLMKYGIQTWMFFPMILLVTIVLWVNENEKRLKTFLSDKK